MADPKQPIDPQKEIEIQVGELEERVDRLRAIYEQYFMGYEKLEPTVPRKDVDRRFVQLRKANIRNTALRFRFNVVTQKFNTYSMYWTRICRQIEEGTFKRHIQKANRRFGTARNNRNNDELSIDVELGDFEVDMDDFDAEESAAAAADPTIPPAPASIGDGARRAAAAGFSEMDDDADTVPPSAPGAAAQHRVARHAVLPAGAKARVLVKKGAAPPGQQPSGQPDVRARAPSMTDEAPPPSLASQSMRARMPSVPEVPPPSMRARMPSVPEVPPPSLASQSMRARLPSVPEVPPPSMRPPMPSVPEAPSTSVIRAAAPAGGHVHRSPAGVNRPQISPNAQSVRRIAVAQPAGGAPPPSAPASVGRVPVAPPSQPQAAAPAPPPKPAPNPAVPPARPGAPPPSTRMPVGLPSSVNRVPAGPPPAAAGGPPTRPAPAPVGAPSERRLPLPPPSQRVPAAPPMRAPSPSVPDSEGGPRSRRPPPPLPSQSKKG